MDLSGNSVLSDLAVILRLEVLISEQLALEFRTGTKISIGR
jgi:hypothetical protein